MGVVGAFVMPHPPAAIAGNFEADSDLGQTVAAMEEAARAIGSLEPDVVVVIAPHGTSYSNYMLVSPGKEGKGYVGIPDDVQGVLNGILFKARRELFAKEVVRVPYDEQFAGDIVAASRAFGVPAGTQGQKRSELDPSALVPLYFIRKTCPDCMTVRCSVSGLSLLDHYRFGKGIAKAARDSKKRVVVVASGDLSHRLDEDGPFGFAPEAALYDKVFVDALREQDFLTLLKMGGRLRERVGECASRSVAVMAGSLDRCSVSSTVLSYGSAGGIGHVVASFKPLGSNGKRNFDAQFKEYRAEILREAKKKEAAIVKVARLQLETYVKTDEELTAESPQIKELVASCPEIAWLEKGSVFVSLRIDEKLRGCFGRVVPKKDTLLDELLYNVLGAAYEDPRFEGIARADLDNLTYEVDVLGTVEDVESEDDLDPKEYGVNAYVPKRKRQGFVLPDPLSLKTPQEQVAIALQKGSIDQLEQYRLERFATTRYC